MHWQVSAWIGEKRVSQPIDVYYWPTPNGQKITVFLEEAAMPYQIQPVDIGKGDQFREEFLKISPNNRMPAIVDPDGPDGQPIAIFESGAILMYLAEKSGKFLPRATRQKYQVLQWLMFQISGIGPMLGQAHHFRQYAPEKFEYAIERYTKEARRLYGVMDTQLSKEDCIAGEYSIADMAIYPWIVSHDRQGQNLQEFPNLTRWFERINGRPGVQRGMAVLKDHRTEALPGQAQANLFGDAQYQRR